MKDNPSFEEEIVLNSQLVCHRPVGILNSCCCSVPSFRCVLLALKSPYGERSIKYVLFCISHPACLRDIMGQSYPIEATTDTNHARYFIGLGCILR